MAEQIIAVRAGFWRRAIAFLIDGTIALLLLEVIAAFAFPLSNGHIQLNNGIVFKTCTELKDPPADMTFDFTPNYVMRCDTSILGWSLAQNIVVGRQTKEGIITKNMSVAIPVDKNGERIDPYFLDWLALPLILIFRWLQDRRGTSLGRIATGMHVEGVNGERPAQQITNRYLLFGLGVTVMTVIEPILKRLSTVLPLTENPALIAVVAIAWLGVLLAIFVNPIVKRRDVFYDRWAGTVVAVDNPPIEDEATVVSGPQQAP